MIFLVLSITTETLFLESPDTSEIYIGYRNILIGSDSVWHDEILLLRDSVYMIDYNKGIIKFKIAIEDTLRVKFLHLGLPIKEIYKRWSPVTSTDTIVKKSVDIEQVDKGNLIINGNKGLYVEVTSGGANITQSLWMRLGGKAGNFDISGVLSDENIPEGRGASQNIREIDEIYVEAISPELSFRLGDIEASQRGILKRLLGLNARWKNFSGVAGITKGKYGKYTFRGEEGNQGPYKLYPGNSNIDFEIVRGSEQVFLDGRLLKSGIEKDYVMNYYQGTITFNPNVFIDSESTILILFQYHPYGSTNIFYNATLEGSDFNISFTREQDYTEKDKFDEVYPDSGFGYIYSASFVGAGNGDYDLLDSIFVYRGNRNGSYLVNFEWAGDEKGEYIYIDSLMSFRWTGDGQWSVKRKVDLPGNDNLLSIDYYKQFESLFIGGEVKARRYLNKYGGAIEDGASGNFNATYSPNKFINLHANYYRRTTDFLTREWEGARDLLKKWELNELPSDFAEYSITSNPTERIKAYYLWGKAGSLRRNIARGEFQPFYVGWDEVHNVKKELRGGLRWNMLNLYIRSLSRADRYKKEAIFESKPLYLGAGLEGNENGDTARIYIIRTNLTYKSTNLIASHSIRNNIESGEFQSISNGTLLTNIQLEFLKLKGRLGLSQKRITKWESYYREVDLGEGDYSYDALSKTYYEDPYGNYILERVPAGEGRNVRDYSGSISFEFEHNIYLQGYLNTMYREELFFDNNISINLKIPNKGKRRFFLRYDGRYLDDKEGFYSYRKQNKNRIRTGLEEQREGYREYGVKWKKSLEEEGIGPYVLLWLKNGLQIEVDAMRILGENTIFTSKLRAATHLAGKRAIGSVGGSLGYNYYPNFSIISERMKNLYPPGIFYDFSSAVSFNITEKFHFVLNGNIHKLSEGRIYYRGRVGVTADFD